MKMNRLLRASSLKILLPVIVCLLITSILSRAFVTRPFEGLRKIHSALNASSNLKIEVSDQDESDLKVPSIIGKRTRDDRNFEQELRSCIIKTVSFSSLWLKHFHRLSVVNLSVAPIQYSISSIEKPPKI